MLLQHLYKDENSPTFGREKVKRKSQCRPYPRNLIRVTKILRLKMTLVPT